MFYEKVLFTEEECKQILDYRFEYPNHYVTPDWSLIKGTRTVYQSVPQGTTNWVKKYNVWDIVKDEKTKWFYNRIYDWFESVSGLHIKREHYGEIKNKRRFAHKLHEYSKGDRFDKHIDSIEEYSDRLWNLGIILNSDFEGGDYLYYDKEDNEYSFSKITGNVVAYSSEVPHEITEITQGKRYAMVIKLHDWELVSKKIKTLL